MIRFGFALSIAAAIAAAGCGKPSGNAHPCDTLGDGGACVPLPTLTAVRSGCDSVTGYCDPNGSGAPDVACLDQPKVDGGALANLPATPARVTLTGFVRALESGPDTSNMTVQVIDPTLLVNGANPAYVQTVGGHLSTLDGTVACGGKLAACAAGSSCIEGHCWNSVGGVESLQQACDSDLALGCVFALTDGCNHSCNDGLDGRRDDGKYCRDDGSGGSCRDCLRWETTYSIDNIPTNRAIVIRVIGPNGTDNSTWAATIRWNVSLSTVARACTSTIDSDCLDVSNAAKPLYRLDVTALAQADSIRLPRQAGLTGGVPNGQGAIYGEVHDCDDIRLANVSVAVSPAAGLISYFAVDPLRLRPDVTRAAIGTDPLGRFSAWGVHSGRAIIDAAGLLAGVSVTSFGRDTVFIYAGTLSIVTVSGARADL